VDVIEARRVSETACDRCRLVMSSQPIITQHRYDINNSFLVLSLSLHIITHTPTAIAGVGFLRFTSVFSPHDISKTDAARITELDLEMSHDDSWKPIYFGVRRLKSRSRVTKTLPAYIANNTC